MFADKSYPDRYGNWEGTHVGQSEGVAIEFEDDKYGLEFPFLDYKCRPLWALHSPVKYKKDNRKMGIFYLRQKNEGKFLPAGLSRLFG